MIAFNELFDNAVRDGVMDKIQGWYPYRVLKASDPWAFENSGLALGSRLPFYSLNATQRDALKLCSTNVYGESSDIAVGFPSGPGSEMQSVFGEANADSAVSGAYNSRRFTLRHATGDSPDQLASKGIAFAGVETPSRNRFNIFFAHMQSGDAEWDRQTRRHQLQESSVYIECVLNATNSRADATTIMMGDLNVDGAPVPDTNDVLKYDEMVEAYLGVGTSPYTLGRWGFDSLGVPAPIASPIYMRSAWLGTNYPAGWNPAAWRTSPFDPGLTWDRDADQTPYVVGPGVPLASKKRKVLDHIMVQTTSVFDVNHATIAWNLFEQKATEQKYQGGLTPLQLGTMNGGHITLSDHRGLNAELSPRFTGQTPATAITGATPVSGQPPPPVWDDTYDGSDSGTIPCAGCAVWYRLNQRGTYSFSTSPHENVSPGTKSKIVYRVYSARDLSRPIPWGSSNLASGNGPRDFVGKEFPLPEGPIFVKVMEDAPSGDYVNPPYEFRWHRSRCESKSQACAMTPGMEYSDTFDSAERWYNMRISRDHTSAQNAVVEVFAPASGASTISSIELHSYQGFLVGTFAAPTVQGADRVWRFALSPTLADYRPNSPAMERYYVRVIRNGATAPAAIRARWQTDLMFYSGSPQILCKDQQEVSSDEIWVDLRTMDQFLPPANCASRTKVKDDFDTGEIASVSQMFPNGSYLPAVGGVRYTLCEDDADYDEEVFTVIPPLPRDAWQQVGGGADVFAQRWNRPRDCGSWFTPDNENGECTCQYFFETDMKKSHSLEPYLCRAAYQATDCTPELLNLQGAYANPASLTCVQGAWEQLFRDA